MFSRFLAISTLAGLAFAPNEEYHRTCKAIEGVISGASEVYYPGESDRFLLWLGRSSCVDRRTLVRQRRVSLGPVQSTKFYVRGRTRHTGRCGQNRTLVLLASAGIPLLLNRAFP